MRIQSSHHHADRGLDAYFSPPEATASLLGIEPMTLGNAAAARVRLIVWCKDCRHQVEPDPAAMAERYGVATTVPEWHERLRCSMRGRNIDVVVTGAKR